MTPVGEKLMNPNDQINRGNNTDVRCLHFQSYAKRDKRIKEVISKGTPVLQHITILVIRVYLPGTEYIYF